MVPPPSHCAGRFQGIVLSFLGETTGFGAEAVFDGVWQPPQSKATEAVTKKADFRSAGMDRSVCVGENDAVARLD